MKNNDTKAEPIKEELKENIQKIKQDLGGSDDIIIREITFGKDDSAHAAIIYTDGLADKKLITDFILDSQTQKSYAEELDREADRDNLLEALKALALNLGDNKEIADFRSLYNAILSGETVLLLEGYSVGIAASTRGWKDRSVSEPVAQSVVRGPQEGFTETLRTNTSMIRRKIKDPNLWLETMQIGKVTKTDVAIMYIKGIVSDKVVEEVRARLDRIDIDGVLESGYIEELIQDEAFSPFPTINNTERPDNVAAELLEGRVAILVDGTPFVLIVPTLFISFFQTAEDYYQRADISTLLRFIRFISLFIAMVGPALYIAITTFHQELLPTQLLISLAAQREGVPFPAFIEALMMEVTFEVLREAGIRMPRPIGQAVSIVGTLVIGQAAVEAGIVSASMVIVVSITAISSFVITGYSMAISVRMIRFVIMGLAAAFGIFGIVVALIALVMHLCSLRSFGVPYMSPFAPFVPADHKDTIFRLPHWAMSTRPRLINQRNVNREQTSKPTKPADRNNQGRR
ncbi:spore germination protein [Paenibacillus arenilitoris]|uniref:Spore germination protein n=1 Tax=Paenibacillus arenilitoris TaxID=2772299 RepID=A0A927CKS3_9BACL|nr:spore germination protein [Paenibacillus arenilitoris]MBD2869893.1 spore germination protein [Paenibacillus arenilitoris]